MQWHNKGLELLKKLIHDCNNTAGLDEKLTVAVGALVMLHFNIDTKSSLVNGAIDTNIIVIIYSQS